MAIITPAQSPLFLKARQHGITVYPLSFKPLARFGEYSQLKQLFASEDPFVVNVHGRADAIIALKAAQKTGVPCRIMSRHNGDRVKLTWPNKKIYKDIPHYVFTTSQDTTHHIKETFGLSDMGIFSIPDGITLPKTLPARTDARKKLAELLGLQPDTRFIGFSGQVNSKGVKFILNAVSKISPEFSHHLVFNRDLSEQEKDLLNKKAKIREKVHTYTPEKGSPAWLLYRALDCCCFMTSGTQFYEGIPYELMATMLSGCPVVGSDTPGIKDILIPGETGLLFQSENPDHLADQLKNTLGNEAAAMERVYTARKKVQKHHTIDAMARNIIRIYRLRQVKIEKLGYHGWPSQNIS
ncbi:MAG: glycosyltransferase family 4 protein [Desulfobacterales bacterium]|nr:glycosyltransferase family 4 protein [Desulfobacterales bacterium]